jgi:hypothetical protein
MQKVGKENFVNLHILMPLPPEKNAQMHHFCGIRMVQMVYTRSLSFTVILVFKTENFK